MPYGRIVLIIYSSKSCILLFLVEAGWNFHAASGFVEAVITPLKGLEILHLKACYVFNWAGNLVSSATLVPCKHGPKVFNFCLEGFQFFYVRGGDLIKGRSSYGINIIL